MHITVCNILTTAELAMSCPESPYVLAEFILKGLKIYFSHKSPLKNKPYPHCKILRHQSGVNEDEYKCNRCETNIIMDNRIYWPGYNLKPMIFEKFNEYTLSCLPWKLFNQKIAESCVNSSCLQMVPILRYAGRDEWSRAVGLLFTIRIASRQNTTKRLETVVLFNIIILMSTQYSLKYAAACT